MTSAGLFTIYRQEDAGIRCNARQSNAVMPGRARFTRMMACASGPLPNLACPPPMLNSGQSNPRAWPLGAYKAGDPGAPAMVDPDGVRNILTAQR
jgi:hypothetical protein